jgi:hypothetical protein
MPGISKRPKTGSGLDRIRALQEAALDAATRSSSIDKVPGSTGGKTGGGGGGKGKQ